MPEWTVEWKSDLNIYSWSDANTMKKNCHLGKYLSCHSTLGRYIYRIYCIEPNLNFSVNFIQGILQILSVVPSCSFHRCCHHSMIRPNCCVAAMDLAAAPPEVFLHWQTYLMVSSFLFISPLNFFGPILL